MNLAANFDHNPDHSSFQGGFDDAAFEVFFKQNFTPMCAYCQFKFGFDLDQAKEVVHTGFIKLWENREVISPNLSPKSYLYKIIINNSFDILKHEKVKQKHEQYVLQNVSEACPGDAFESAGFKQLSADVDEAVAGLPEQMRRIFELSRYEGMKYAEIAGMLHISVKTVETQMSRALGKLRQKLSGYLSLLILLWMLSLFIKK
jgi:RNA polymerase sigma-70 factor, ECF subfamily